jgi:uncharacterized membrane protein HdeD (DUF308 family)
LKLDTRIAPSCWLGRNITSASSPDAVASGSDLGRRASHRLIAACGALIILLSAGAALLPIVDGRASAAVVGSLLLVAGLVEGFAGKLHRQAKGLSALSGVATALAGLLFILNPVGHVFPTAFLVTGWLIARCVILAFAGFYSSGSVRRWTLASAAMDFFLAVILLMGLSLSSLIITLFGPTAEVVAGFAWILALSFVVTGAMLLEIASCERRSANG